MNNYIIKSNSLRRLFSTSYDLAVIGGGPGGYVAAIRGGQKGLKTVCIEGRGALGGTCLNVGCIPSKFLLNASKYYNQTSKNELTKFGINIPSVELDLPAVINQKGKVVKGLTGGIEGLLKKNKVDYVKGWGSFKDKNTITVSGNDKLTEVTAKNIIIATGSSVTPLPNVTIDEQHIISSTGALEFQKVPESLLVVGGGVIGLEMAQVWNNYGSKVTVVEFLDKILPLEDEDVSKEMEKIFKKKGITIRKQTKLNGASVVGDQVQVQIEDAKAGKKTTETFSKVLVCIGRKANTQSLQLDKVGITTNPNGKIPVSLEHNSLLQTSVPNIYAIGDCVDGPMLAHKAEEDGVGVVDFIKEGYGHVDWTLVPGVVYTSPEVASIGKTEQWLKQNNVEYKKGTFPFLANSRATANVDTDGFVKFLCDKHTDEILGIHIISPQAGEMIQTGVLAMNYGSTSEDIGRVVTSHPTLMEAFKEASMMIYDKPIHF